MTGHVVVLDIPHGTIFIPPAQAQFCRNKIAVSSAAICQLNKAAVFVVVSTPKVFFTEKYCDFFIRMALLVLGKYSLFPSLCAPIINQDFVEVHIGDAPRDRRRCLQVVVLILFQFCRGEVAALCDHLTDPLLNSCPLDNKLFIGRLTPKLHA